MNTNQLLFDAVMDGDIDTLDEHFDEEAHVALRDDEGHTLLMLATDAGHSDIVRYLLDCGAHASDFMASCVTALHIAAGSGDVDIARLLIEHGAEIDTGADIDDLSALMLAVISDQPEMVRLLLDAGSDPDYQDRHGYNVDAYVNSTVVRAMIADHRAANA